MVSTIQKGAKSAAGVKRKAAVGSESPVAPKKAASKATARKSTGGKASARKSTAGANRVSALCLVTCDVRLTYDPRK